MSKIIVYTSPHCRPCEEIKDMLIEASERGEIDLVDISTDEGFAKFTEQVLSRGDGAVPSAYNAQGKRCDIINEDGRPIFKCPEAEEEVSS